MIKLDHDRSCPWVQIAQVTKAPTIKRGDKGGEKLAVSLAPLVWKLLLGREMRWDEVAQLEPELHTGLDCILSARAPNGYKYTEAEFNGTSV